VFLTFKYRDEKTGVIKTVQSLAQSDYFEEIYLKKDEGIVPTIISNPNATPTQLRSAYTIGGNLKFGNAINVEDVTNTSANEYPVYGEGNAHMFTIGITKGFDNKRRYQLVAAADIPSLKVKKGDKVPDILGGVLSGEPATKTYYDNVDAINANLYYLDTH
jgi:hypothetical protein